MTEHTWCSMCVNSHVKYWRGYVYRVTLTKDELDGGWVADCIDLPGCLSQGETQAEALENLRDVLDWYNTRDNMMTEIGDLEQ